MVRTTAAQRWTRFLRRPGNLRIAVNSDTHLFLLLEASLAGSTTSWDGLRQTASRVAARPHSRLPHSKGHADTRSGVPRPAQTGKRGKRGSLRRVFWSTVTVLAGISG